jgi:hypothetical protein
LARALSSRHPLPCEELEALVPEPVVALRWAVDHVAQPPWAGMRAAECLTRRHPVEVVADLERWVTDPALKGLGRQTLALLPEVPLEVALVVARRSLEGPEPTMAREKLAADPRLEVRALVVTP